MWQLMESNALSVLVTLRIKEKRNNIFSSFISGVRFVAVRAPLLEDCYIVVHVLLDKLSSEIIPGERERERRVIIISRIERSSRSPPCERCIKLEVRNNARDSSFRSDRFKKKNPPKLEARRNYSLLLHATPTRDTALTSSVHYRSTTFSSFRFISPGIFIQPAFALSAEVSFLSRSTLDAFPLSSASSRFRSMEHSYRD